VVLWLALGLLAGCATGKDAEVKRLQARAAYERGWAELNEGRKWSAIQALEEAVALDPRTASYRNGLGLAYLDLKDPQLVPKAIEQFKRAVDLDPGYGEGHQNLGVAYAEAGRWEEALRAYRKALALPGYQTSEVVHHNSGWAYYNLGRLREAEESYRLALKIQPDMASAHYQLGLVLLKGGRREEARAAFRRARELAPDTPFGLAAQQHLKALGEGG
jgi:tetratricopeptide (TPR) repeat protein